MKNVINWKTTLIGLVIILGGLASVFMGKSDWTGAVIVITLGIGLVFSPDSILKKNDKS